MNDKTISEYRKCEIESQGELEEISLGCQLPITVKVLKKFPFADEAPQYEEVSLDHFQQQHHFQWIEGYNAPKEFIEKYVKPTFNNLAPLEKELIQTVQKAKTQNSKVALYKIDDKFGHGVMYDGKNTLGCNQVVDYYSGTYAEYWGKHSDNYIINGLVKNELFTQLDDGPSFCIDAEKYGNATRFINSMPSQSRLEEFELATGLEVDSIAVANLMSSSDAIGTFQITTLITTREIKPREIWGFDYGPNYWARQQVDGKGMELLMTKSGRIIPSYMYRLKEIPVKEKTSISKLNEKNKYKIVYPAISEISNVDIYDLKEALIRNHYACAKTLLHFSEIDFTQPIDNIYSIRILKKYVDPEFKCYPRKGHEELGEVCDAVIKVKSKAESLNLIKKFYCSGIFPIDFGVAIVIEGINQEHIITSFKRLEKIRIATDHNENGVKQVNSGQIHDAISSLKKAVICWTLISQENPLCYTDLAQVHHNIARAYEKNNNITFAIVHFYLSEKFYLRAGNIEKANKENTEKEKYLKKAEEYQKSSSLTANTAKSSMTHFSLPKIENWLLKFKDMQNLFISNKEQYKIEYAALGNEEKRQLLELYLQEEELLKFEDTNLIEIVGKMSRVKQ